MGVDSDLSRCNSSQLEYRSACLWHRSESAVWQNTGVEILFKGLLENWFAEGKKPFCEENMEAVPLVAFVLSWIGFECGGLSPWDRRWFRDRTCGLFWGTWQWTAWCSARFHQWRRDDWPLVSSNCPTSNLKRVLQHVPIEIYLSAGHRRREHVQSYVNNSTQKERKCIFTHLFVLAVSLRRKTDSCSA